MPRLAFCGGVDSILFSLFVDYLTFVNENQTTEARTDSALFIYSALPPPFSP
jgi:hypothetical protein